MAIFQPNVLKEDNPFIIVKDDGVLEDGRPYWLYIAVMPSKYKEFMEAITACASINYSEFGSVLCFGFEKGTPSYIREEMKETYGFDENFLEKREVKRMSDIIAFLKKKDFDANSDNVK